jgi:glycosyltransferase involved in cell wall biosynthesis
MISLASMKEKLSSLTFIIPAYNDEDTIESVIREATDVGRNVAKKFDLLVIDDKSPDKTGEILDRLKKTTSNLQVIHHKENKGYGGTIRELYEQGKGEWLFSIPGDYQIGAKELLKLTPYVDKGDMIIGWRVNRHDPKGRLKQSKIYNILLRLLFTIKLHDINSVRLMRSSIMKSIRLTSTSAFVDAELTIRTQMGSNSDGIQWKVIEVPIEHRSRSVGEETAGGGKIKTILPTIWEMVKFAVRINYT